MEHTTEREGDIESIPELAVLKAMGAYDNFGRHTVMSQRESLTKTQMDAVIGLDLYGSMSMTQMSEHLAVSKEQTSRAIAPLVERGVIKRERSPREHRVVEISLTERGKAFSDAHKREAAEDVRERLALLSEEDRSQLIEVSRIAERLLSKLRAADIERKRAARADDAATLDQPRPDATKHDAHEERGQGA